jgi:PAS domain-containing protein
MADQLRASYSGLEAKVEERTRDVLQRESVLRITFDNMTSGVVMFNSSLKLAAWNAQFREMLELPDSFFTQKAISRTLSGSLPPAANLAQWMPSRRPVDTWSA